MSTLLATLDTMTRAAASLAELVQEGLIAGVHLEGPFLSQARCGTHAPDLLRPPTPVRLLGLAETTGAVQEGLAADLVVLDAGRRCGDAPRYVGPWRARRVPLRGGPVIARTTTFQNTLTVEVTDAPGVHR